MMMTTLIGTLAARPPRPSAAQPDAKAEWVRLINERIHPPVPVGAADVHVRMLRLVSDEVNDHGGRFPRDEHVRLCELLIDTPVLIGHDRTHLPVARNFAARCVDSGGRQWVEVWFYWLRGDGANHDQLAADIDAGLVKEGSIGFEFRKPQCSICARDIRTCDHVPDHEYADAQGSMQTAHYEYRDIVRVLETSLVYRGATPGTHFASGPVFCKMAGPEPDPKPLERPAMSASKSYAVVLGRDELPDGSFRHLAARRDPDDPLSCGELEILSEIPYVVGERLVQESGRWMRFMPDDQIDRHLAPAVCSPTPFARPLLRVWLSRKRRCHGVTVRRAVSRARLRLMFGAGRGRDLTGFRVLR
ncbi:MAG: hypothetical protein HY304_03715 [candidate division Zixibacteria bacterium]|nr:hypothetical protein [candidate division Zixibacteria bacterium]